VIDGTNWPNIEKHRLNSMRSWHKSEWDQFANRFEWMRDRLKPLAGIDDVEGFMKKMEEAVQWALDLETIKQEEEEDTPYMVCLKEALSLFASTECNLNNGKKN